MWRTRSLESGTVNVIYIRYSVVELPTNLTSSPITKIIVALAMYSCSRADDEIIFFNLVCAAFLFAWIFFFLNHDEPKPPCFSCYLYRQESLLSLCQLNGIKAIPRSSSSFQFLHRKKDKLWPSYYFSGKGMQCPPCLDPTSIEEEEDPQWRNLNGGRGGARSRGDVREGMFVSI